VLARCSGTGSCDTRPALTDLLDRPQIRGCVGLPRGD
jgi:hypothetical protein